MVLSWSAMALRCAPRSVTYASLGIKSCDIAGQRDHLDTIEPAVCRIVADDHRRTRLAHFTTDRRIERYPPHLAALWVAKLQGSSAISSISPSLHSIASCSRLLIGRHLAVSLVKIVLCNAGTRQIIEEPADASPPNHIVQPGVTTSSSTVIVSFFIEASTRI